MPSGRKIQGKCLICKLGFVWYKKPKLVDAICPHCHKVLYRTTHQLIKRWPRSDRRPKFKCHICGHTTPHKITIRDSQGKNPHKVCESPVRDHPLGTVLCGCNGKQTKQQLEQRIGVTLT